MPVLARVRACQLRLESVELLKRSTELIERSDLIIRKIQEKPKVTASAGGRFLFALKVKTPMLKIVAVVSGKLLWRCDKCGKEFERTKEQSQYLPTHTCNQDASPMRVPTHKQSATE